jgi:hypothetical protein
MFYEAASFVHNSLVIKIHKLIPLFEKKQTQREY